MDAPPPPPGFTLDKPAGAAPPPPPGFTLDAAVTPPQQSPGKATAPPPPPGFKLDAAPDNEPWDPHGLNALIVGPAGVAAHNAKIKRAAPEKPGLIARTADDIWQWYKGLGKEQRERTLQELHADPKQLNTLAGVKSWAKRHLDPKSPEYRDTLDQALNLAMGTQAPGKAMDAMGGAKLPPETPPGGPGEAAGEPPAPVAPEQPKPSEPAPAAPAEPPPAAPKEGPLSRPAAIHDPKQLTAQLYSLEGNRMADAADALHTLDKLPKGIKPETWEKLYHHEESPEAVPLDPAEKSLYEQHIAPLTKEADKLSAELEGYGYEVPEGQTRPAGSQGYTPRYKQGAQRSFGETLARWQSNLGNVAGGAGRSLRKTVDAQKSRRYYEATNPETGDKAIVHVGTDGKVMGFDGSDKPFEFGKFPKGQRVDAGSKVIASDGNTWRLGDATTQKIEDVTRTQYHKNLMANRLDNLAKLRSATRNAKFLDSMTKSPEWEGGVAVRADRNAVPPETRGRPWRIPKLPQFRQWYVEPRIADALDDFSRDTGGADGLDKALLGVGRVMNGVMFINPKAHIDNVLNHMMISRGVVGNIAQAPSTVKHLYKAIGEVLTAGPTYTRMLRSGLSLPYARYLTSDLHDTLLARLGAMKDDRALGRMAAKFGYPDTKTMLKRFASVPNRALWIAGDIMTLARATQLMEEGSLTRGARGIEDAIKETHQVMPSYRVPGTVLGSRALHELFANPAFGRFGRYQFNKLEIYADDVKKALGRGGGGLREQAEALDRLAMLGVYTFLVYPLIYDPLAKLITGNKNATTTRAGASSISSAIGEAARGDRKIGDVASSVFTLGVPLEIPSEIDAGRYSWSGQPIVRDADMRAHRYKQVLKDGLSYGMSKLSTIGQMGSPSGRQSAGEIGYRALGYKSPSDDELAAKEKYKRLDAKSAARRSARQPKGWLDQLLQ